MVVEKIKPVLKTSTPQGVHRLTNDNRGDSKINDNFKTNTIDGKEDKIDDLDEFDKETISQAFKLLPPSDKNLSLNNNNLLLNSNYFNTNYVDAETYKLQINSDLGTIDNNNNSKKSYVT